MYCSFVKPLAEPSRDQRPAMTTTLPALPVYDLGSAPLAELALAVPAGATALREIAEDAYGRAVLQIGDRLSRAWAERHDLEVAGEIASVASAVQAPGAWMLNLSFEWGCTAAVWHDDAGLPVLRRTLDWPLPGLGREAVVAKLESVVGHWFNLAWPGFVGVLTGHAPGRFAASINQAPMRPHGYGRVGDWLVNRVHLWRRGGLPPAVLLRQVFETAPDFEAALQRLATTPLCMPVIFSLVGTKPGELAVIERLEGEARVHRGETTVANHWLSGDLPGRMRSKLSTQRSPERQQTMRHAMAGAPTVLGWLQHPVLNETTRLATELSPGSGAGWVQGWEASGPVTAVTGVS
jgi:hypothetical protein